MSMNPSDPVPFPVPVPDPGLQQPDPAEVLRKQVFTGFAAIIAVGLAVAGLYIGGRLFARPRPQPRPLVVATVDHPPKPSPVETSVPVPVLAPAAPSSTFVTPKIGEKYLQLAALPADYLQRYVKELEGQGIHVSVAPG